MNNEKLRMGMVGNTNLRVWSGISRMVKKCLKLRVYKWVEQGRWGKFGIMENESLFGTAGLYYRFDKHLKLQDNTRIIFSGPFGIGKTTFLENYFAENRSQFFTIKIDPVHYSLASNEDIFELIKYDVLFQLFKFGLIKENKNNFKPLEYLPFFISNEGRETISYLVKKISKTGKSVFEIVEHLEKLNVKYKTHKTKINSDLDYVRLEKYINDKKELFYLFEDDLITKKIRETINLIHDSGNETILIIDDLDRIDPEHIFRLFNVFSAHLSYRNEYENKFGFDKIIFVCDIQNIRSIFHAKYGSRTDFSGYIDKFYSTHVFSFGNKETITGWFVGLLRQNAVLVNHLNNDEIDFVIDTLTALVNHNLLNIRSLKK